MIEPSEKCVASTGISDSLSDFRHPSLVTIIWGMIPTHVECDAYDPLWDPRVFTEEELHTYYHYKIAQGIFACTQFEDHTEDQVAWCHYRKMEGVALMTDLSREERSALCRQAMEAGLFTEDVWNKYTEASEEFGGTPTCSGEEYIRIFSKLYSGIKTELLEAYEEISVRLGLK
ncbi:hypothetical protein KIPB_002298 [Kipferlia bialata]|uniref:Uncharacterized protein n=1 Tax=Kipferlia bialata TaxID=797122 RepID=A0A9K3CRJ7_9EUKA|nr:hypothetical protein KIPB_002298 [Kipferlia bialata]|eukprot:g2298.t1